VARAFIFAGFVVTGRSSPAFVTEAGSIKAFSVAGTVVIAGFGVTVFSGPSGVTFDDSFFNNSVDYISRRAVEAFKSGITGADSVDTFSMSRAGVRAAFNFTVDS